MTDTETGQIIGGPQWSRFEKSPYTESNPTMVAYWIQEGGIADIVL